MKIRQFLSPENPLVTVQLYQTFGYSIHIWLKTFWDSVQTTYNH